MIYYINQLNIDIFDSSSVFKQNSNFYNFNFNESNILLDPVGSIPSEQPNDQFFINQDLFCSVSQQLPDDLNIQVGDDPVVELNIDDLLES